MVDEVKLGKNFCTGTFDPVGIVEICLFPENPNHLNPAENFSRALQLHKVAHSDSDCDCSEKLKSLSSNSHRLGALEPSVEFPSEKWKGRVGNSILPLAVI